MLKQPKKVRDAREVEDKEFTPIIRLRALQTAM